MSRTDLQVVAHRGSSHEIAEHTLAAYVAALDEGADGLECDVRLTADGHLVCVHDRTLRRVAASNNLVSTMALADLEALDFAAWKHPWSELDDEAPERDPVGSGVLTLRRLLETASDYDRRVEFAIETKHPTRYGGLVEKRVCELLHDFGLDRPRDSAGARARVMSFSYTALQRMQHLCPAVPVVQLVERRKVWRVQEPLVDPDWILGVDVRLLRKHPKLARRLGRSSHPLHSWTVNTPDDLELCLDLGVRAVISDRPRYLMDLLGR